MRKPLRRTVASCTTAAILLSFFWRHYRVYCHAISRVASQTNVWYTLCQWNITRLYNLPWSILIRYARPIISGAATDRKGFSDKSRAINLQMARTEKNRRGHCRDGSRPDGVRALLVPLLGSSKFKDVIVHKESWEIMGKARAISAIKRGECTTAVIDYDKL